MEFKIIFGFFVISRIKTICLRKWIYNFFLTIQVDCSSKIIATPWVRSVSLMSCSINRTNIMLKRINKRILKYLNKIQFFNQYWKFVSTQSLTCSFVQSSANESSYAFFFCFFSSSSFRTM